MNKIINFINDTNLDTKTQNILNGDLNLHALHQKILQFNSLSIESKQLYLLRLTQRIQTLSNPLHLLTTLLLIHHIFQCNPRLPTPPPLQTSLTSSRSKQSIILINIIKYYTYFIRCNTLNRFDIETINPEDQLTQALGFCQISLRKILEFVKIGFLFERGVLLEEKEKRLVKAVLRSILGRFAEDLRIVHIFLKNNLHILKQRTVKHPLVFGVNAIYEQTLRVNRQLPKIIALNRYLKSSITIPSYEITLQENREIQFAMQQRKKQQSHLQKKSDSYLESQTEKDYYHQEQQRMCTYESFILSEQEHSLIS